MWPYYKLLPNLPAPPQHFLDRVIIDTDNLPTTSPLHEVRIRFTRRNGQQFMASPSVRTLFTNEWETWVCDNIVPEFVDTGINWRHFNSDTGGIHTDTTRDYTLSWNITNGGPECGVTWWQEQGQPIQRGHAIQHLNFDNVNSICKLTGPDNTWFIIDARILHSAEHIISPRVQFQIGLNEDQIPWGWLS
jgi:hypothetical protein